MSTVTVEQLTAGQAPLWSEPLLQDIRAGMEASGERLVVLDDDPTGSQTVHGIPLMLTWDASSLTSLLADEPVVFLLTNSRSLRESEAVALNVAIGELLRAAAAELGVDIRVASRSDSTLRGHWPAEVDGLVAGMGAPVDGQLIVPAFIDGGRITVGDVHYVVRDGQAVPVADTEFAQDQTFGFRESSLPAWVEERSGGRVPRGSVVSISLDDIRSGGPKRVTELLAQLTDGQVAVVNACDYRDLEVVALATQRVEAGGKRLVYRCGASFVRVRGAITDRGLLAPDDLPERAQHTGGMVICGSHVPMSTLQVRHALTADGVVGIEVDVTSLLEDPGSAAEIARQLAAEADEIMRSGATVLIYTSRELVTASDREALDLGQLVSGLLADIASNLTVQPLFVVAKGGITSHEVAAGGFGVRHARVLGQILPGVSVWSAPESRLADVPYAVFPGNVGGPQDLLEAMHRMGLARS